MGAQWKHAGRIENSSKRGALIGKLIKEILVAAKQGDPLPENNARLRAAIEAAKKASVPRDNIERALKKASGQDSDSEQFDSIVYEGFGPYQIPVLVECLTDNKNRTAADIRLLFRKGTLGSPGSVAWMFERVGILEATAPKVIEDWEEVAIEIGANSVERIAEEALGGRFYCAPGDLEGAYQALAKGGWTITQSELGYHSKVPKSVESASQEEEVIRFFNELDQQEDVHRLYTGFQPLSLK